MERQVIVGGGLAGTFLALRLLAKGQQVTLIDDGSPYHASRVAAGLFNVITGRFGAKSWMADILLPAWNSFLTDHPRLKEYANFLPIYRPFKEVAEYNKWTSRSQREGFKHLVDFHPQPLLPELIQNPHGGIMVKPCGWVEIGPFIQEMHQMMQLSGDFILLKEKVDVQHIYPEKSCLETEKGRIDFDHLSFCRGFQEASNPLFPKLPLIPNKGEILEIHAPELRIPWVLSRKIYLIPKGEGNFVVGSTYRNMFDDPGPSKEGQMEICQHLEAAIKVPYEVTGHRAGIRPTTKDRKPLLGSHPTFPHLHMFSGFGTKGLLLAPYFSEVMAVYILEKGSSLHPAINLDRFY